MILEEKDIEGYVRDTDADKLALLIVDALPTWKAVTDLIDALCALLPDEGADR